VKARKRSAQEGAATTVSSSCSLSPGRLPRAGRVTVRKPIRMARSQRGPRATRGFSVRHRRSARSCCDALGEGCGWKLPPATWQRRSAASPWCRVTGAHEQCRSSPCSRDSPVPSMRTPWSAVPRGRLTGERGDERTRRIDSILEDQHMGVWCRRRMISGQPVTPAEFRAAFRLTKHDNLDRCFVEEMTRRTRRSASVRGSFRWAQTCIVKLIAEGVETLRAARLLWRNGCAQDQRGFTSARRCSRITSRSGKPGLVLSETGGANATASCVWRRATAGRGRNRYFIERNWAAGASRSVL